ncbi:MAG: cysteine desulfurase [Spirulinaceae cyanobacterium SM2_1_0]|nr:cysteine desulfurase [Spirulinaceae cyanobacterium SM2_1_0]
MTPIYLDYHATTPTDPRVAARVQAAMTAEFGNASSVDHEVGDRAATAIKTARQPIATLLHCRPRDILFTAGATESLNLAIQGKVNHLASQGKIARVACTTVEHDAVLATGRALAQQGRIELTEIPVNNRAQLDLGEIETLCAAGLDLLCVMAANNEVGTVYPVREIAAIANRHGVAYLCDAAQAVGKIPLDFDGWGVALLACSAHKLYGPQGVGALIVRRDQQLAPLFYGGGQQQGLRPGTLNLPGIVGLGEACRWRLAEMAQDEARIAQQRDRLQTLLQARIPGLQVNGDRDHCLAGNLHISIPDIPNSAVTARLRHPLAISTGSACASGVEMPSHVLRAMHLPDATIEGALRLGLGKFTTDAEIDRAADLLAAAVSQIRAVLQSA